MKIKKKKLKAPVKIPFWIQAIFSSLIIFFLLADVIPTLFYSQIAFFLLIVSIYTILYFYLKKNHLEIFENVDLTILFNFTLIIQTIFIKIIAIIPNASFYIAPIACNSILLSILLNPQIAIISGLILSLLVSFVNNLNFIYFLILGSGSICAAYICRKVNKRADITRASLYIIAVHLSCLLIISLFSQTEVRDFLVNSLWLIGNGFLSVILALGLLPFLESFFHRASNIKLLELSNFDHPLLKRLATQAPGTYQHSVIVSSLAENATQSIGGNIILARVGGYYHDIGKLIKPEYFIENQIFSKKDVHQNLSPTMSRLIISSHVKEGVRLAREANFDSLIIDIIEQHHGTSLIHYFYSKAILKAKKKNVEINEEQFRYPGPKPQTKEAGIIMLADALEASTRSANVLSYEKIKELVDDVIEDKFRDGQLDECRLTFKELSKIRNSFIYSLASIFHSRIEYPDKGKKTGDKSFQSLPKEDK